MRSAKRQLLGTLLTGAVIAAFSTLVIAPPACAQVPHWETTANHAGDPLYVQMPYEVVFVATKIVETTESCNGVPLPRGHFEIGTDVLFATKPSAGNSLWVVTRNGDVKRLFPLRVHGLTSVTNPETGLQVPLIDTPPAQLSKGSVVEPNVSEDGTRVIFSYFHDATFNIPENQGGLSKRGADLYVMDMSALLADPTVDPADLPVRRLTFRTYDGTGAQDVNDKNKNAMNPVAAEAPGGLNGWGTVFLHGVEMRTAEGLKMVYVSGEKRLMNSNQDMSSGNYNLNLSIADLNPDGSLGARRQFQYYTTTAALSPAPLPNGIAFSYQATTGNAKNWQIQRIDSAGRWAPLIGYGSSPDLFHLGGYCVSQGTEESPAGDYFLATRYYNANNNGYGSLWRINLAETGINTYDDWGFEGAKPKQTSAARISLGIADGDEPSPTDAGGHFIGKITSPRCGRPDELFFSYTPTSANGSGNGGSIGGNGCSSDGKDIYHAYIAYRSGLEPFQPTATWTPGGNDGLRILVDDSNDVYTLAWPVPLLSWQQRTGQAQQAFSPSAIDPASAVLPGEPFAQVGTSAIYNTDRRPYDCWLGAGNGSQPYNPNTVSNEQKDKLLQSFDGVTRVSQVNGVPAYCEELRWRDVLGIQVNITSNNINHRWDDLGYVTDNTGEQETVRQLGVYDVRDQEGDGSFQAMIPAHVPFELHLLDRKYGMRLVDVRSWHSLQPRETRTDCGGCHQHEQGQAIPFAGTVASTQPPLDMVTQTQTIAYTPACAPIVMLSSHATERMPEWKQDVWPGFNAYCASCHTTGTATPPASVFNFSDELTAYVQLKVNNYAGVISGALGSPAFWAARGERTDGRNNALYAATSPPYRFSAVHSTTPGLCGQNDAAKAAWVHTFGQWIDNHMPRDTSGSFPADKDRYHPTVDSAYYGTPACDGSKLRVGYWDDSGLLKAVQVLKNGTLIGGPWGPNLPNGTQSLTGLSIAATDVIKVLAEDPDGNRQGYEKTGRQLTAECVAGAP